MWVNTLDFDQSLIVESWLELKAQVPPGLAIFIFVHFPRFAGSRDCPESKQSRSSPTRTFYSKHHNVFHLVKCITTTMLSFRPWWRGRFPVDGTKPLIIVSFFIADQEWHVASHSHPNRHTQNQPSSHCGCSSLRHSRSKRGIWTRNRTCLFLLTSILFYIQPTCILFLWNGKILGCVI